MSNPFSTGGSNINNFSPNNGSLFGNNGPMGPSGAPKQNKNQIITNLYKTIFGRDPDPSALMYYISLPEINEDQVRKQMVESEEHKNILNDFKSIASLKKEVEDLKKQILINEQKTKDKQIEIDQLNNILSHKTNEITKARNELEELRKNINNHITKDQQNVETTNDEGFVKKILKAFMK